jgi:hypothetical protein
VTHAPILLYNPSIMIDWSFQSKWIFSGIGVFVLGLIWEFIKRFRTPSDGTFRTSSVKISDSRVNAPVAGRDVNIENYVQGETNSTALIQSLRVIIARLENALGNLQRAAHNGAIPGQPSDEESMGRIGRSLSDAQTEFSSAKVLMDKRLEYKIAHFMEQMVIAGLALKSALNPLVSGDSRAGFRETLRKMAFEELPPLIEEVKDEARTVVNR